MYDADKQSHILHLKDKEYCYRSFNFFVTFFI